MSHRSKRVSGLLLKILGILTATLGGLFGTVARYIPRLPGDYSGQFALIILVLAIVFIWVGIKIFRLGKRIMLMAPRNDDPRPQVIYLRPFERDLGGRKAQMNLPLTVPVNLRTFGEQLADAFEPIGPFHLLMRPDEKLPELGGNRARVANEDWQAKVAADISRARLVVLRAGASGGLRWEVEQCLRVLKPEQLILLLPGDKHYKDFAEFAELFGRSFPKGLPAYKPSLRADNWIGGVVWFRPDWEPVLEHVKTPWFYGGSPLARTLVQALAGYRATHGINLFNPASPWRRYLAIIIDALIMAGVVWIASLFLENVAIFTGTLGTFLYFIAFESSPMRGTPGKRLLGLHISGNARLPISPMQVAMRLMLFFVSLGLTVPWIVSVVRMHRRKTALHDLLTGTQVEDASRMTTLKSCRTALSVRLENGGGRAAD